MNMVVPTTTIQKVNKEARDTFDTDLTHIAVGSDSSGVTVTDTALGSETFREAFFQSSKPTNNKFVCEIFMDTTENNGNTINESGTFTSSSGGTMYSIELTNSIAKDSTTNAFVVHEFIFEGRNV